MKNYKIVHKPDPKGVYQITYAKAMNIPHLIRRMASDLNIDINSVTVIKQITL